MLDTVRTLSNILRSDFELRARLVRYNRLLLRRRSRTMCIVQRACFMTVIYAVLEMTTKALTVTESNQISHCLAVDFKLVTHLLGESPIYSVVGFSNLCLRLTSNIAISRSSQASIFL